MGVFATILLFALTRAELIERFKADPITRVDGLVQAIGDCPADMRREYLAPIAANMAGICNSLYRGERMKPIRFDLPAIIVHIGDVRTNISHIAVKVQRRDDGTRLTKMFMPSPGFADIERFRLETVKAFYRAVKGEEIDDETAIRRLHAADPDLRARDNYADLDKWLAGEPVKEDDEHFLKLMRSVIKPGYASESDVLRFASRLRLYPRTIDGFFCGRFWSCSFAEAVEYAKIDPRLRLEAYAKAPLLIAYGGGHGESLLAAAEAYSKFLFDFAAYTKTKEELLKELEEADAKLNQAYEESLADSRPQQ